MKKHCIIPAALTALALMAASCIYPFTPEPEDGSGALVIEGDIYIGEMTKVRVSRTAQVPEEYEKAVIEYHDFGDAWVVDDAGTVFYGQHGAEPGSYIIDTRDADPSRLFSLHFRDATNAREYASEFERVCAPPVIDSLSYNLDFSRNRLNVALSMHALGESFFKWDYVEDWEYHSIYNAQIKFVPDPEFINGRYNPNPGHLEPMIWPENTYYCYKHAESSQIMTFSTERQTDDRFVDLEFLPIARDDRRLSYLYRIVVNLEPLTSDAYRYWENVKANSEYRGDLFAPNPSELVGNIRCLNHPEELVMGYVNVAQRASKQLVLRQTEHRFFKDSDRYEPYEQLSKDQWREYYYSRGWLPFAYFIPGSDDQVYWAQAKCVDCTRMMGGGGTRVKPDDWPPVED